MKKLLALFLTLILLSATVFANESYFTEEIKNDLNKLGIMVGDQNGDLHLENTITRAEAVKMICVSGKLNTDFTDDTEFFPDVPASHWAYKYIRAAKEHGIVIGDEKGCFNPDNTVTNEEIIKMLVCLLGYEPMAEQRGGYPAGYRVVASQYKLTEGFSFDINNPALRQDVAVMVWRTLDTPMLVKKVKPDAVEYVMMNGENGYPLYTLRNGITNWDTSRDNIFKYAYDFAAQYEYKEGDTEKSFTLYPDIVYTSGIELTRDGKEYECPAVYDDLMAQNLINTMENGKATLEINGNTFETDYITFASKILIPYKSFSNLGLTCELNPAAYTVRISDGDTVLEILPNVIGMRKNQANGYWVPLEVCARIFKDTFYVPLDAVLYEYGYVSEFDSNTKSIIITKITV